MKNIPNSELKRLESRIGDYLLGTSRAIEWGDIHLKGEVRKKVTYDLKGKRRKLKNIKNAILQRPAAALFGESQVGKSYLIKSFLSNEKGKFEVVDPNGSPVNFLDINPKGGGTESTSVVCRFSTRAAQPNKEFPLLGKLLSAKDLFLVLCDTYFNDVNNHVNLPTNEIISVKIDQLKEYYGESNYRQDFFTEDDIYEIKEYLETYFKSKIGTLIHSDYWDVLASLIHKIDDSRWYSALDIVFGENNFVQIIFNRLLAALKLLDFSPEVYLNFETALNKHGTILSVKRLKELISGPQYEDVGQKSDFIESVKVLIKNGDETRYVEINKSELCAVLAEIEFKIDPKKEEGVTFLEYSDLLDFPGANPRLKNNENTLNEEHLGEMLNRGKVGYLFNRYSSQYVINNLLLCHYHKDLKAKEIPHLLNTWIGNFIGESEAEREAFLKLVPVSPLFKIFTFFNEDLKFDNVHDVEVSNYSTKWTKRFKTIFEDQIISPSYSWNEKWSVSSPNFTNNYLLRDYIHSREIFSGFLENGQESSVIPTKLVPNYHDLVKKSFVKSDLVNKYFSNPERSWDEASLLNKDGSDWVLYNLTKVASNFLKTKKFLADINKVVDEMLSLMEKHYHDDDSDKRIVRAKENADKIRIELLLCFKEDPTVFGKLMKQFVLREEDVFEFYDKELNSIKKEQDVNYNQYNKIRQDCGGFSSEASFEENIIKLQKHYSFLTSSESVRSYFEGEKGMNLNYLFYGDESVNVKNNSQRMAERLIEYWGERFLVPERFQFLFDLGFPQTLMDSLFGNIKASFKKHTVSEIIAKELRDYVDGITKKDEIIFMISDISAGIINNYIDSMGWKYYGEEEKGRIYLANEKNELGIKFERINNDIEYDSLEDIAELFDLMKDYENHVNAQNPNLDVINRFPVSWHSFRWTELLKISFITNCDIPTYDVQANEKLGKLIQTLKTFEFKTGLNVGEIEAGEEVLKHKS